MSNNSYGKCTWCGQRVPSIAGVCKCEECNYTFVTGFSPAYTRGFQKVSIAQYLTALQKTYGEDMDILAAQTIYDAIKLPQRATTGSAGYDFFSPISFHLPPGKTIKIASGIKSYMQQDEVLSLYVRSSTGFKYSVNLCNSVGQIDFDYFDNEDNEGHIWFAFINHGDKDWFVRQGEAFAQGIFTKYLLVDDDAPRSTERVGGVGSTNG